MPASSVTIKKVSHAEKDLLSNFLQKYDKENLEKINKEIELNKASHNDKMLMMIESYHKRVEEFIKEPSLKT